MITLKTGTHGGTTLNFGAYGGYGAGEQMGDFVFIDDVVAVNLWFFDHPQRSGIFNLGSGCAQPFNDVASAVVNTMRELGGDSALPLEQIAGHGLVEYVPFPDALRGKYQCFTQADQSRLVRLLAINPEYSPYHPLSELAG